MFVSRTVESMRTNAANNMPHNRPGQSLVNDSLSTGVFTFGGVIIRSTLMRDVLDLVARIAPSDASVLLTGESGVGKEVIARAL